jgi:hypothetical protein
MTFTLATDTPATRLGYGFIPMERRGLIHTSPVADSLIKRRAIQGPARMGRRKK